MDKGESSARRRSRPSRSAWPRCFSAALAAVESANGNGTSDRGGSFPEARVRRRGLSAPRRSGPRLPTERRDGGFCAGVAAAGNTEQNANLLTVLL